MENRIKRLAYITSMATGGLAGFNFRELSQMQQLGVNVSLFVTKYIEGPYMAPSGISTHKAPYANVLISQPTYFLRTGHAWKLFREALATKTLPDLMIALYWRKKIETFRSEWIHCHWGDHKLYIGYYCHKLTGIPLSVTLHGYDLYDNPNWFMFEKCLHACTQIITISDYNKRLLTEKYGPLGEKVKVIRLSADLREDPSIYQGDKNLLIVGGFHLRKGYDTLLKAMHHIDREDIKLWIVGYDGPVDVRGYINDFNLDNRVTIFGHVSDEILNLLYKNCDIFCMPSKFGEDNVVGEGLPVSLMEAMSHEKPVVATRHTGIPELVPDILVDEDDYIGLAEGIVRLSDNPELRREMGIRNRKIIEQDYSNKNVGKLLDAFKLT